MQNELEESSRLVSMSETQVTDLSVEDGLNEQKVVFECPKEDLRLKEGTVQQISKEEERLPTKLEEIDGGNKLEQEGREKVKELTRNSNCFCMASSFKLIGTQ